MLQARPHAPLATARKSFSTGWILSEPHAWRGDPVYWLSNNTGGSLLLAYLMHAASNFWPRVLPMAAMAASFAWLGEGVTILAVALVVLIYGPAHLSRNAVAELPILPAGVSASDVLRTIRESRV